MYFGSQTGAIPLQIDPPDHSRYRKMLDPLFSPRRMAEREQEVTDLANQLIDTFVERGSCDFSTEFAVPFPSVVFLRLMGLPTDRLDEFVKAKEGMIRPVGETEADRQAMRMETGAWIFEYFTSALDAHAENDTSDVLGTFLALEQEGRLTRDETLNICLLMLAAGLDTVTDTLECSFAFLAQSPAHQRQLADDPDLAAGAVEELLRFETPVPTVARIAMAATEIDGCPVAAGERVRPILAVANIDPDVHGDPDAVDFAASLEQAPRLRRGRAPLRRLSPRPAGTAGRAAASGTAGSRRTGSPTVTSSRSAGSPRDRAPADRVSRDHADAADEASSREL